MSAHDITITVNGKEHKHSVDSRSHLADFLRQELGLTGTHIGCEHGVCGACTVLVDGASARSCLMLAVQTHHASVQTIEGLSDSGEIADLQAAFRDRNALQCGFCTPGVVMTLLELQRECGDTPMTEAEIRRALSGNLCRCTGYQGMVEAALAVLPRTAAGERTKA